jgi:hypothetical protein
LRIPVAMRPTSERVIALTDKVCADLLDEEYVGLARHVVAKLARKRPSPLQSGRPATWAGGTVWALGQVNFLFDPSTEPYVAHDDLADALAGSPRDSVEGRGYAATFRVFLGDSDWL